MENRAAQFSPFAALTGYEGAIKETARLTDRRVELDEYEKAALNDQLQQIAEHLDGKTEVSFTVFWPDEQKDGGEYVVMTGVVRKIDAYSQEIVLMDGRRLPIEEIIQIEERR